MTKFLKCVQERFSNEFPEKSAPDKSILRLVEKFNEHDTIWNLSRE